MTVLVTGFGAFPGVPVNPTASLAQAVDGRVVGGRVVRGLVLPVSYARGPALTVSTARELGAQLVVGLGVAVGRLRPDVERIGRRCLGGSPDVDGRSDAGLLGPDEVRATLDVQCLADALDAGLSDDAGTYVCNAWLYQVTAQLDVPVGFVHVPADGMAPERLLRGLEALLRVGGPSA